MDPQKTGHLWWTVPVWIGLFYLIIQMIFLLQSASQIRALGVLDSVVSIFPLVAGLVLLALGIVDSSKFNFTAYQHNSISVVIVVSAAEFLLTIWIRFVVNRRTLGLGTGG
jgi:membrane protein insertase Oxa1/YidC/SpoIIIJ